MVENVSTDKDKNYQIHNAQHIHQQTKRNPVELQNTN